MHHEDVRIGPFSMVAWPARVAVRSGSFGSLQGVQLGFPSLRVLSLSSAQIGVVQSLLMLASGVL